MDSFRSQIDNSYELDEESDTSLLPAKHVIIRYDGCPYPGKVIDTSPNDIEVTCMHQIGKGIKNCFFWPGKRMKDVCWYELHNILAIIPPPEKLPGKNDHFKVNDSAWDYCMKKL